MTITATEAIKNDLCPCGSGLVETRCCALQRVDQPTEAELKVCAPLLEQAQQLHEQENPAAAEQLCIRILEQVPAHRQALRLLIDLKQAAEQPRHRRRC